jgi:hypothetical protein
MTNRFKAIIAAALLGLAATVHAEILPGSQAYDVEKLVATAEKYSGLQDDASVVVVKALGVSLALAVAPVKAVMLHGKATGVIVES